MTREHSVGIPLIVLGLLGLSAVVRIGPLDLAVVLAVVVLCYYAALDQRGAFTCLVAFAILYWIGVHIPWQANVAAFVLGWCLQLLGHRFEGNTPKFLENAQYLLIGPLYFFLELATPKSGRM